MILFLITIKSYLQDTAGKDNDKNIYLQDDVIIEMAPGLSKTLPIKYFHKTNLNFKNNGENSSLQVNIHSINCYIEADTQGEIINEINLNTYSIIINASNESITIEPVFDKLDGKYKENYERKKCYLSINSYYLDYSIQKLKIENKEENIFYLSRLHPDLFNISYEIKNISNNSFILLNFRFKDAKYRIDIYFDNYNNETNLLSKYIYNSTNIYLDSGFLLYNNESTDFKDKSGVLSINIFSFNDIDNIFHFKLIEKETICILEKNALTFGFLTTKAKYQYYHAEIFKHEEGELMLHNKRFYGELYGKIIDKDETNENYLNDTSIYPNSTSNDSLLEYNQHFLKLKYNRTDTSRCFNGCILLITYEQSLSKDDFPLAGYEFTILSRSWNYTDYITQIIDIPQNEFIIGCFDKGSEPNHYYSIYIPNDIDQIEIEIEGNYLEFFYTEDRKRINTLNPEENTKKLEINNNKGVFTINATQLNFTGKPISFAIKPYNYYSDIFSFYYFRVLCFKKNEKNYYPLDSYLENLCIPEYDSVSNSYYCNYIMKNNYNESNLKFIITSNNYNEYFNITTLIGNTDGIISDELNEFLYEYNSKIENIDFYIFHFEFTNNDTKNIFCSFLDSIENIYPQIYSPQIFFIIKLNKTNHFNIKNKYSLIYQYIYGSPGYIIYMGEKIYTGANYIGRPLGFPADEKANTSKVCTLGKFAYLYQLIDDNKNRAIEEVILGEPKSQIINGGQFPIYFYLKFKDNKYINVIVNLRLKAYIDSVLEEDIEVYGYLLTENEIQRKINGEYIKLKEPIKGIYLNGYNIGYLQIIKKNNENYEYLLIEIIKKGNQKIDSCILVDVVPKEYNENLLSLPLNRYIFETFNDVNNGEREANQYHININQIGEGQILIELSPQYDDIEIKFENVQNYILKNISGFKKYRIDNTSNYNIYFNVTNPKKRPANYMIRYYYTTKKDEYEYYFDENFERKDFNANDNHISISLSFNSIKIKTGEERDKDVTAKGIYFFITGTLYKRDKALNETINTTSHLTEHIPFMTNITTHFYNYSNPEKWTLVYENIPRNNNFIYDMQIQMNAILSKSILNEEMLIYKTTVDLTDIKIKPFQNWIIPVSIVGGLLIIIIIVLFVIFIKKYIRIKKRNENLQLEMKSMAFSNDVQNNILINQSSFTKKVTDYETTFI